MSVIKSQKQQTQTVGNSIGSRREFLKEQAVTSAPAKPAQHQPLDKFVGGKNLEGFAPNASFKAVRAPQSPVPYKKPLHDFVEQGTTPARAGRPSDTAILNFLDKVIAISPANGLKTLRYTGKPVVPAKAQAQRAATTQPKAKTTATVAKQAATVIKPKVAGSVVARK
jgi:hypothetical protein